MDGQLPADMILTENIKKNSDRILPGKRHAVEFKPEAIFESGRKGTEMVSYLAPKTWKKALSRAQYEQGRWFFSR